MAFKLTYYVALKISYYINLIQSGNLFENFDNYEAFVDNINFRASLLNLNLTLT